jgi:ReqiPepy6 Gp37-like protein
MSVYTTVRLADAFGNHLIEIANYSILDYILNCAPGAVGVLELTLPTSFDTSLLFRDGRLGVWRAINGRPPYLDNGAIYLIETIRISATNTFVRAYHANVILSRRIIAYAAGSSQSDKAAAAADDQIKTFASENMGTGIVAASRDGGTPQTQADISAYVTIQANTSQGASVAKACARRNLLTVCQELAEASNTAGTYLTFEIYAPTESTLELRTYATQRGVDRRASTAQAIILSELRGNLQNAALTTDYQNEVTFAIAGGQGEGTLRLIATTADTARMGVSPFGRIEQFVDMSNVANTTTLQDDADAAVRDGRPVILFTGTQIDTPAATRGIHYDLGDILTAEDPRSADQFDVRLDMIHEHIDSTGTEQGNVLSAHQVQKRRTLVGLRSVT